jgi:hypothetical protein
LEYDIRQPGGSFIVTSFLLKPIYGRLFGYDLQNGTSIVTSDFPGHNRSKYDCNKISEILYFELKREAKK